MNDPIHHPAHYEIYPIQPIRLTSHLGFCLGNAVKYVLRAPYKGGVEDCDKALRYLALEELHPMKPLYPGEYRGFMDASLSLVDWLNETPGDQLWRDIAEWQSRFVWEVRNYISALELPAPHPAFFRASGQYVLDLSRILSLRDTTGQIYEGMSGLPREEDAK